MSETLHDLRVEKARLVSSLSAIQKDLTEVNSFLGRRLSSTEFRKFSHRRKELTAQFTQAHLRVTELNAKISKLSDDGNASEQSRLFSRLDEINRKLDALLEMYGPNDPPPAQEFSEEFLSAVKTEYPQ